MERWLSRPDKGGNDEAIPIGLVMASVSLNYEPSKFVNYWWLREQDSNLRPSG